MKICPHCSAEIPDDAAACPVCGEEIARQDASVTITFTDQTGLVPKLGVYVDGHKVGEVNLSEKITFTVEAGERVFFVKEEFSESPKKKISVKPGDVINLSLKSKYPNSIGSMYAMFFNPKNHFILERIDS